MGSCFSVTPEVAVVFFFNKNKKIGAAILNAKKKRKEKK